MQCFVRVTGWMPARWEQWSVPRGTSSVYTAHGYPEASSSKSSRVSLSGEGLIRLAGLEFMRLAAGLIIRAVS
jgi:hypothetical protein